MKKFNLGFNPTDDINKEKISVTKKALIYTALVGALSVGLVSSYETEAERLRQQTIEEQRQIDELNAQLEALRLYEEEQERLRIEEETKARYAAITEEAQEIRSYYMESQNILDQMVYIDTDLNYDDLRREYCEEYYGDAIDEIAPKFGFSPNVIRAIATQEGGGILENVMQVSEGWKYKKLRYYDYELNRFMYLCVTSEHKEDTEDTIYICTDDPNWSVWLGCVLFQQSVQYNDGHLFAGFTHYNRGDATPLVNTVAQSEGMTHDEYLEDIYNAAIQYYEYNCYILYVLQFRKQ